MNNMDITKIKIKSWEDKVARRQNLKRDSYRCTLEHAYNFHNFLPDNQYLKLKCFILDHFTSKFSMDLFYFIFFLDHFCFLGSRKVLLVITQNLEPKKKIARGVETQSKNPADTRKRSICIIFSVCFLFLSENIMRLPEIL